MKAVLTIAGSDSSGGAGIQADLKTIAAHHLFGESVITALTAQNTLGVTGVLEVDPVFVGTQIDAVFDDIRPDAVKIGMVSSPAIVGAIADGLDRHKAANVVVDPVMVATSGSALIADAAVDALVRQLFPRSTVITPNIPEAEVLSGMAIASLEDVETAASLIADRCIAVWENEPAFADAAPSVPAILIKGAPFEGPIVYTGPLDELFLSRFGRLPYRSLDFVYETHDVEHVLPCGTVNFTVTEDYTRITEFKYLTGQVSDKTTIMKEYSHSYDDPKKQIPYYAIINDENAAHYERYRALTTSLPNFHPLGRLAEYRYYNMDVIIGRALALADELVG